MPPTVTTNGPTALLQKEEVFQGEPDDKRTHRAIAERGGVSGGAGRHTALVLSYPKGRGSFLHTLVDFIAQQ
jgi:hypothetical protein